MKLVPKILYVMGGKEYMLWSPPCSWNTKRPIFFITKEKFNILKYLNEQYICYPTDVSTFANKCQGQSGR